MWTKVEHLSERIVTFIACGINCKGHAGQILTQNNTSDGHWSPTASVMRWRLTHKICLNGEWHTETPQYLLRSRARQINSLHVWWIERKAVGREVNKATNDSKNIISMFQCHWNLTNNAYKKLNMLSIRAYSHVARDTTNSFTGQHSLSTLHILLITSFACTVDHCDVQTAPSYCVTMLCVSATLPRRHRRARTSWSLRCYVMLAAPTLSVTKYNTAMEEWQRWSSGGCSICVCCVAADLCGTWNVVIPYSFFTAWHLIRVRARQWIMFA